MNNHLKNLVEQQFIISKLKKDAKNLHRERPQHSLMECQNHIAQQHGYSHWHELHTVVKKRLEKQPTIKNISTQPNNNFLLGIDSVLEKNIYLNQHFNQVHIQQNQESPEFIFRLFKEIMFKNYSKFIYCATEKNPKLKQEIENYAKHHNISLYYLSFTQEKKQATLGLNFSTLGAGSLTELMVQSIFSPNDVDNMWKGRAIHLLSTVLMALCYMRDNGEIKLTPHTIRQYVDFNNLIDLNKRTDFPEHIKRSLNNYVQSATDFGKEQVVKNDNKLIQHGYLQMEFMPTLNLLCEHYDYLFDEKKTFIENILKQQKQSILIVNFPDFDTNKHLLKNLFHLFMFYFNHSFFDYIVDKKLLHFPTYILLENTPQISFNIPIKFGYIPLNYIFLDNKNREDKTTVIPKTNNHVQIN